jgi:hypothetical protein
MERGFIGQAALNMFGTGVLGVAAAVAGLVLGRML